MIDLPATPSFRLDGRRALVAGGTSGIGLGAAVALAEANAQVSIIARSTERLKDVAQAFKGKSWPLETISLDIADVDAVARLIDEQAPFDIVVNSAGLARHSPATQTTQEDYDAVTNLNVRGAFFLIQAAAKRLIAAGKPGSMMTISSQMAKIGGIDRSVYCATKHAVEGFTKAMAIEFGPHRIRVNTICPTFIKTPLTEPTFANPERVKWIEEKIKLGRVGEVEDIMGAVQYLASDASALVTGSSLLVDGGWTAG
jgi:NAD(P)-dependent dehydrogenase (short-subunit alcohol dehydrogenase family)